MDTKNLPTLKINKLTKAQYERELAAGNIDEDALYLTPEEPNTIYFIRGESTYDEIKAAYDAGKTIFLIHDTERAILSKYNDYYDSFEFCSCYYDMNHIISVNKNNEWSGYSIELATKSEIPVITPNTVYFTYGESTYDEIKAAYDAGKTIYMKYGNILAVLASYNDTNNKFDFCVVNGGLGHYYFSINNNNAWEWKVAELAKKADLPIITYGTEDLEAGVSELATGTLYFVYE